MVKGFSLNEIVKNLLIEGENKFLRVFHGTEFKFVEGIKKSGLEDKTSTPYQQGWYMLSTDFESALFHAKPSAGKKDSVYVFEFNIPIIENDRWEGYPYLWAGAKMKGGNIWYALMEKIPRKFIKKVHKVSYEKWIEQKGKFF